MTRDADFFRAVAAQNVVRPRVAGIVVADGKLLVQRWSGDSTAYAFIGGEYEVGDTLEAATGARRLVEGSDGAARATPQTGAADGCALSTP